MRPRFPTAKGTRVHTCARRRARNHDRWFIDEYYEEDLEEQMVEEQSVRFFMKAIYEAHDNNIRVTIGDVKIFLTVEQAERAAINDKLHCAVRPSNNLRHSVQPPYPVLPRFLEWVKVISSTTILGFSRIGFSNIEEVAILVCHQGEWLCAPHDFEALNAALRLLKKNATSQESPTKLATISNDDVYIDDSVYMDILQLKPGRVRLEITGARPRADLDLDLDKGRKLVAALVQGLGKEVLEPAPQPGDRLRKALSMATIEYQNTNQAQLAAAEEYLIACMQGKDK